MRRMVELPQDLIDLLAEFESIGVEYLLIGGQAMAVHGHPRFTKDADLWVRDTPTNIGRVEEALRAFGAPPDVVGALREANPLDVVWMGSPPNRIDLMKHVPGGDFEKAFLRRQQVTIRDVTVTVVGADDLAALKRASGRPQDLVDAEKLDRAPAEK